MPLIFPLDDISRVAQVRRAAIALAQEEGLEETLAANLAIVTTEICTNLVKHAQNGEVFLSRLSDRFQPGVEILAVDRGPGMTDPARCLTDGYSSSNTSGTGLGAVARLSHEFDIFSEQGLGTVLVARVLLRKDRPTSVGVVIKPIAGEVACGDAWAFREKDGSLHLIVADGLGHGTLASRASAEAIKAFGRTSSVPPAAILQEVHAALRSTRGAAAAVAFVNQADASVQFAGIGNIGAVIASGAKPRVMVSHNGTAGYHSPRFQQFSYPLTGEAIIVMHSDGLHTKWNLDDHPGLRRRDPSIIAGVLYRDAARNRDDICVVVAKTGAPA